MPLDQQDKEPVADASGPSDEAAFDAALAEFDGEGLGSPADAADDDLAGDDSKGAEADTPPADKSAADPDGPASDSPPDDKSQNDVWASAPEELRKARDAERRDLDLKYRSAASRQSAADRKVAELSQQLAELQSGKQGRSDDGAGGSGDGEKPKPEDRLKIFREDYPDIADPVEAEMADIRSAIEELRGGVGDYQQQRAQAFVAEQESILTEQHSDWREAAADERFAGWMETQPQAIQEAMQRNFNAIVDGRDAALVIGQFKSDVGIGTRQQADRSKPDPVQEKRERQLKANRDTGRTGPSTTTGIAKDDFDGAVEAFAKD